MKRDKHLHITLTKEEYDKINNAAKKEMMPTTSWSRIVIVRKAEEES